MSIKPDTNYNEPAKSGTGFGIPITPETGFTTDPDFIPSILYDTSNAYDTITSYIGRSSTQKPTQDTAFGSTTKPVTSYERP